ncbi:MAG: ribonucleoside-triphosphate reductase [Clostridiales bacterium]|nr:ribonucleoside-triphosphate reductase [Candidatus Crickella caballi]
MNNTVVKNENGLVGNGVGFERIRRITGYLVGTLDRFNNGKRAEVDDRVKHSLSR